MRKLAILLSLVAPSAFGQAVGTTPTHQTFSVVTETTMTANTFVSLDPSTGYAEIYDPTTNKQAVGMVLIARNAGATATVYRWGKATGLTGQPIGQRIYAGRNGKVTWGNASTARPEAESHISVNSLRIGDWAQEVGFSFSATTLHFNCMAPAIRKAS